MIQDIHELDPFGGLITRGNFTVLVDEADGNNIYVGQAQLGSDTDDAVWQILKIITSGTDTLVKWASGTDRFDKVWDSRTGYTYS